MTQSINAEMPVRVSTQSARENLGYAPGARVIAGVSVSDSPLITDSIDYAQKLYDPYLFNHAMRSWLFAARIGR